MLARAVAALRYRVAGLECMIAGRGTYLPELQSQIDIAGVGNLDRAPRLPLRRRAAGGDPSRRLRRHPVALRAVRRRRARSARRRGPLIVADTGGLAELVGGTGSALLFEPGNADELADCIERVLTDGELAAEMVDAGGSCSQATYSWDAIAGRTMAVYHEALGDGR